jgi:hypothetical protein
MIPPPATGTPEVDAALVHVAGRLAADPVAFVERLATAHHEAGHAVAYYHWGLPIEYVGISGDSNGIVQGRAIPGTEKYAGRLAVASLAGPVAEARFVGAGDWSRYASERDREYVEQFRERRPEITVERLAEGAERLVSLHWRAIEAIALELNATGRVDGATVADLVRAARPLGGRA